MAAGADLTTIKQLGQEGCGIGRFWSYSYRQ